MLANIDDEPVHRYLPISDAMNLQDHLVNLPLEAIMDAQLIEKVHHVRVG